MIAGELPPPPMAALIGLRLVAIEPGRARFELDADHRHHNPMGTLHGGILCDIADSAMGMALRVHARRRRELHDAGAEDQFPAARSRTARLIAEGTIVAAGRRRDAECSVTDANAPADREGDEHLPDAARRAGDERRCRERCAATRPRGAADVCSGDSANRVGVEPEGARAHSAVPEHAAAARAPRRDGRRSTGCASPSSAATRIRAT